MNFKKTIEELMKRGLISQIANEDYLIALLEQKKCTFYIGIDPSNDKYHIGHLVAYIFALRLLKMGMKGVILVGGFTGKVGDPSFRNTERPILEDNIVENNTQVLLSKLKNLFRYYKDEVIFVNNADWLNKMSLNDFLNYSNYISANKLLKMDHIKNRLEEELPLSFKEVCYTLLQSIDFEVLHKANNVNIQLGGNDQWINIINGVHLIDKMHGNSVIGITLKLLLTKEGKKMGKTENGALWADGSLNIFEFWQYWRNVPDEELKTLFYMFSLKEIKEIHEILPLEDSSNYDKKINEAKIILANEITTLIYGEDSEKKILDLLNNEGGSIEFNLNEVKDLATLLVQLAFVENKSEAKRQIEAGAVKINLEKITGNLLLENLNKEFILTIGKNKKAKVVLS